MSNAETRIRAVVAAKYARDLILRCVQQGRDIETLPDALAAQIEMMENSASIAHIVGNKRLVFEALESCKLLRESALYLPVTSSRLLDALARTPTSSMELQTLEPLMAT